MEKDCNLVPLLNQELPLLELNGTNEHRGEIIEEEDRNQYTINLQKKVSETNSDEQYSSSSENEEGSNEEESEIEIDTRLKKQEIDSDNHNAESEEEHAVSQCDLESQSGRSQGDIYESSFDEDDRSDESKEEIYSVEGYEGNYEGKEEKIQRFETVERISSQKPKLCHFNESYYSTENFNLQTFSKILSSDMENNTQHWISKNIREELIQKEQSIKSENSEKDEEEKEPHTSLFDKQERNEKIENQISSKSEFFKDIYTENTDAEIRLCNKVTAKEEEISETDIIENNTNDEKMTDKEHFQSIKEENSKQRENGDSYQKGLSKEKVFQETAQGSKEISENEEEFSDKDSTYDSAKDNAKETYYLQRDEEENNDISSREGFCNIQPIVDTVFANAEGRLDIFTDHKAEQSSMKFEKKGHEENDEENHEETNREDGNKVKLCQETYCTKVGSIISNEVSKNQEKKINVKEENVTVNPNKIVNGEDENIICNDYEICSKNGIGKQTVTSKSEYNQISENQTDKDSISQSMIQVVIENDNTSTTYKENIYNNPILREDHQSDDVCKENVIIRQNDKAFQECKKHLDKELYFQSKDHLTKEKNNTSAEGALRREFDSDIKVVTTESYFPLPLTDLQLSNTTVACVALKDSAEVSQHGGKFVLPIDQEKNSNDLEINISNMVKEVQLTQNQKLTNISSNLVPNESEEIKKESELEDSQESKQ